MFGTPVTVKPIYPLPKTFPRPMGLKKMVKVNAEECTYSRSQRPRFLWVFLKIVEIFVLNNCTVSSHI